VLKKYTSNFYPLLGRVEKEMEPERPGKSSCPPRVWVLTNPHPGNRIQAIALAEALGWHYEVKELHFRRCSRLRDYLPFLPLTSGLNRQKSSPLKPPWPDLVIGVGRSTAPVTRWVGRASKGQTLTVQLGRDGGAVASRYDAVVTPLHCRLPPDPRRYNTIAPLNSISLQLLSEESEKWPGILDDIPRPVIVLLVGGDTPRFHLNAEDAEKMALKVRHQAEETGGGVVAVTSRRTSPAATQALKSVLTTPHRVFTWQPDHKANPYRALLAKADVLVVTGESESMLAEAAATTAPLYIFPVKEVKSRSIKGRLREWCVCQAHAYFTHRPVDEKSAGIAGAVSAWLLRHGLIRPRRDISLLHQALFASGRARPFGEPLTTEPETPLPAEAPKVAHWLKKCCAYPA